ncbi:MAG: hypothetical protein IKZ10_04970 [Akkermansia sp.]|nr:hypothetical protein [Akkermansia sp.]
MKTSFILFAGAMLVAYQGHAQEPAPSIDAAPVKITQRIIYNSDKPVSFEDRQKALALRNICRILEGVSDKESADAAADAVYENMLVVNVGGDAHLLPDEEMTGQQSVDYWTAAKEAGDRLSRVFFYGSVELALAMGMPPEMAEAPSEAQLNAAREYLAAMREAVVLLSRVVDDRSAAAAAEPYMALRWRITPAQSAMGDADLNTLLRAVGMEEGEMMYLDMATDRIRECNFYGSPELAVALGFSAQDVVMPGELTPEAQIQLENILQEAFKKHALSGGPGLTRETAWRLPEGVVLQSLMNDLPACMKQDSPLLEQPGFGSAESYDVCDVMAEWEGKSYKLQLWIVHPAPPQAK